jgi:hypothetical protein
MNYEKKPTIIKKSDVETELQKRLGNDKLFKFECEVIEGKLRIGLKEMVKYSPYYYEKFYDIKDLEEMNTIFKGCKDLNDICTQLKEVFPEKETVLKEQNDYQIIDVIFKIKFFAQKFEVTFDLERKTIPNKDDGLKFLYEIQKENIKIMKLIKDQCLKNKNDPSAQKILQLIQ